MIFTKHTTRQMCIPTKKNITIHAEYRLLENPSEKQTKQNWFSHTQWHNWRFLFTFEEKYLEPHWNYITTWHLINNNRTKISYMGGWLQHYVHVGLTPYTYCDPTTGSQTNRSLSEAVIHNQHHTSQITFHD